MQRKNTFNTAFKATKFSTAIHLGERGFLQGVASPRPCLEFSLPRLGLELSEALPRLG